MKILFIIIKFQYKNFIYNNKISINRFVNYNIINILK